MKEKLQFKDRLRQLMLQRGIGSTGLAREVGLTHVSILNYLKGKPAEPKGKNLRKLCEFFHVTQEWFLGQERLQSGQGDNQDGEEFKKASIEYWRSEAEKAQQQAAELREKLEGVLNTAPTINYGGRRMRKTAKKLLMKAQAKLRREKKRPPKADGTSGPAGGRAHEVPREISSSPPAAIHGQGQDDS